MEARQTDMLIEAARLLKEGPVLRTPWLPVPLQGRTAAWLEPVTWLDAGRPESIELLAQWHQLAWSFASSRSFSAMLRPCWAALSAFFNSAISDFKAS